MSLAFNLPINSVSFGQISTLILRELYNSKVNVGILPIANVDLSTQSDLSQEFANWLQQSINSSLETFNRKNKIFKLGDYNKIYKNLNQNFLL